MNDQLELMDTPLKLIDGALVARKSDSGVISRTIFKVVIEKDNSDDYPHSSSVRLIDQEDQIYHENIDNLELVTSNVNWLSQTEVPDFSLKDGRTIEDVYKDIEILFVQMMQYYQSRDVDKKLCLTIRAEGYPGDSNMEITHRCSINYDYEIITNALDKSVRLAIDRYDEDKANKPKEIAFK